MSQFPARLPDEVHDMLRYEAIRQKRSMNKLLTEAIREYIESSPQKELRQIRRAVVSARAKGRRSLSESLRMAKKAAALDDAEGLGTIKVSKSTTKV